MNGFREPANDRDAGDGMNNLGNALNRVVSTTTAMGPFGSRRIAHSVGIGAVLLVILFFSARAVLEWTALPTPARVVIALLPLPGFVWLLRAFVRDVRNADELERRIQLEALAVAFPLTMLLVMTLGLLQVAVPLNPNDWSYRDIWPLLYVFYLFGLLRARRSYQ